MSEWETISGSGSNTFRMNVEGGWVYRYGSSVCFVPFYNLNIPRAIKVEHVSKDDFIDIESEYISLQCQVHPQDTVLMDEDPTELSESSIR